MPMPPKPKVGSSSKTKPTAKKSTSTTSKKPATTTTTTTTKKPSSSSTAASSKKPSRATSSTSVGASRTSTTKSEPQQQQSRKSSPATSHTPSKINTPRSTTNNHVYKQTTAADHSTRSKPLQSAPCDLLRISKTIKYIQAKEFIEQTEDEIVHFSAEIDELFLDEVQNTNTTSSSANGGGRTQSASGAKIPRIVAITDKAVYKFPFSIVLNEEDEAEVKKELEENNGKQPRRQFTNTSFFSFEERRFPLENLLELVAIDNDRVLQGHQVGGLDVEVFSRDPETGATVLSFTLNFGELTARRQAFLLNLSMVKPDLNIMEKKKITRVSALHQSPFASSAQQQQQLLKEEEEKRLSSNSPARDYLMKPNVRDITGRGVSNTTNQHHVDPFQNFSSNASAVSSSARNNNNNGRPPFGSTFMKPTTNSIQRKQNKKSSSSRSPENNLFSPSTARARKQYQQDSEPLPPQLDPKNYDYEREKMMEESEFQRMNQNNNNNNSSSSTMSAAQQYEFDKQKNMIHEMLLATTELNEDFMTSGNHNNNNNNNRSSHSSSLQQQYIDHNINNNDQDDFMQHSRSSIQTSVGPTSPNPKNPFHNHQQNTTMMNREGSSMPSRRTPSESTNYNNNNNDNNNGVIVTPSLIRHSIATATSPRTGSIYNNYKYNDFTNDPDRWNEREEIRAMLATREEQIATDTNFREMSPRYANGRRRYTEFAKGVQIDFPKQGREYWAPEDLSDAQLLGPSLYPQWRHWKTTGGLLQVLKDRKARMMEKAERDRQLGVYHATNSKSDLMSLINGNLASARSQSIAATTLLQNTAKSRRNSIYNAQEQEEFDLCEDESDGKFQDELDGFDFCDEAWNLYDSDDLIRSLKQLENEYVGKVGKKSLDRLKEMRRLVERERRMFANSALVRAMEGGGQQQQQSSSRSTTVLSSALSRSYIPSDPTSLMNTARSRMMTNRSTTSASTTTPEPFRLSLSPNLERYVRKYDAENPVDVESALNDMRASLSARNRTMQDLQREEYLRQIGKEYAHGELTSPRALMRRTMEDGEDHHHDVTSARGRSGSVRSPSGAVTTRKLY